MFANPARSQRTGYGSLPMLLLQLTSDMSRLWSDLTRGLSHAQSIDSIHGGTVKGLDGSVEGV